ncbi:MAG: hypothetical protein ACI4SG_01345 [Oligosphaeraceae bacterium]
MTPRPAHAPGKPLPWELLLCLFLLLRCLPWLPGELWYDEVLSLDLFLLPKDSLLEVFRDYRIANNHILANAVQWLWLRLLPFAAGSELLLRTPPLLFSLGALLLVARHWARWLGRPLALWTGFLLAASPLFAAFGLYMRGYPLALFLSTLALTLLWERREKGTPANALGLFLCSLALPLVMPSAALTLPALFLAGLLLPPRPLLSKARLLWPLAAGGVLGGAYYLTLWEEFQRARVESGGWSSGWLVAGHLLLAFGLHLLPAIPLWRRGKEPGPSLALAAGCLAAVLLALVTAAPGGHAPFPRVFLPLLPLATLAAVLPLKERLPGETFLSRRLLALALLPGLLLGILGDRLTRWQLSRGKTPPQNLLQQYYRGDDGNRLWTQVLAARIAGGESLPPVAVNPTDYPAFSLYWRFQGLPLADEAGHPRVFPANTPPPALLSRGAGGRELLLLARNPRELQDFLTLLTLPEDHPAIPEGVQSRRTLFRLSLP